MMQQQWEVERPKGQCAATGRPFEEGEEFYTVLFEEGETFRRTDYCAEAWEGCPEDAYCHFKTRVPIKEKRKQLLVNNEMLVNFFIRLAKDTVPVRIHFRFVIALILMRKKLLRYERSIVEDGAEVWDMVLVHDQTKHRVYNPRLSDEQIEEVSRQLSAILHDDMGEWAVDESESEPTAERTDRPDDDTPQS